MSFLDRLHAALTVAMGSNTSPRVEGMPDRWGTYHSREDTRVGKILRGVDALFGRVTYDAGPNFARFSSYPGQGLTPQVIQGCLKAADNGIPMRWAELCEQVLERDAHLSGIDYARRVEVSGKPFRVQPRNESDVAVSLAKFVRSATDDIDNLEQALESLSWANGQGWACGEIIWREGHIRFFGRDGAPTTIPAFVPHQIDPVHSKHFEFDLQTDEPYLVVSGERQKLPPNKFVFHTAATSGGPIVERRGFMRACIWLHAAKQWAIRDWLVFAHLFGIPQIEGLYDGDIAQQDDHRDAYELLLKDFGEGKPVIHPRDFEVKITQPPSGGKSSDVHGAICGFCNAEMSKRVQGETLTTEMGQFGSYGAANTHADVRFAIVQADARRLAKTLREDLFRPLVELNMAALQKSLGATADEIRASVPSILWRIDRETTPEQRARIYSVAVNEWGMAVDEDSVRDEFGIDSPRPGSTPLSGKPQQVSKGAAVVGSLKASREGVQVPSDKEIEVKAAETQPTVEAPAPQQDAAPVEDAPESAAAKINLTPSDIAIVVTVNEARASQGLSPWPDADGKLSVAEFKAKHSQTVAEAAAAESGTTSATPPLGDRPEGE